MTARPRVSTQYDYAAALRETETFFWWFCDDYIELVKRRRAGDGRRRRRRRVGAAQTALSVMLRLFAPFLPFVTEEVWSWWQDGSVHRAAWPIGRGDREAACRRESAAGCAITQASAVTAAIRHASGRRRSSASACRVRRLHAAGGVAASLWPRHRA